MKELIKHSKIEPITRSVPENPDSVKACIETRQDSQETNSLIGRRKVRQAAATIGLAISMGATGIVLDKEEKAIAAEAITTKPTLTNLSQNNKGINSSLTSGKLTVKSSANQIDTATNTTPVLIHKVKPQETIDSISREYDLDPEAIAAHNNLDLYGAIKPGQMLKIPVNRGIVNHSNAEDSSISPNLKRLNNKQKRLEKSLSQLKQLKSQKNSKKPILLTQSEPKPNNLLSNQVEEVKGKVVHKVQQGDTLGEIAIQYGVSIAQLVRENRITDPNAIQVDRELVITLDRSESRQFLSNRYISRKSSATKQDNPLASQTDKSILAKTTANSKSSSAIEPTLEQKEAENNDRVNPYVAKLRADIEKLRQGYKIAEKPEATKVSTNVKPANPSQDDVASAAERLSNPEWLKQRLQRQNSRDTTDSRLGSQTQNKQESQLPAIDSLRISRNSRLGKPRPQLINSLEGDGFKSNNSLKKSVINSVSPQLPPLSAADRYLPSNVEDAKVAAAYSSARYRWPSNSGIVTSGYGWRWGRFHKGVDIAGPVGTPILAAAPGKVIYAGWNSGGYGNLVKIRHYDGSTTLYAHNSSIVVRRGQSVGQGQMIARMGSTGFSTGPHLHFEIHKGRGAVNPMAYLPRRR